MAPKAQAAAEEGEEYYDEEDYGEEEEDGDEEDVDVKLNEGEIDSKLKSKYSFLFKERDEMVP